MKHSVSGLCQPQANGHLEHALPPRLFLPFSYYGKTIRSLVSGFWSLRFNDEFIS